MPANPARTAEHAAELTGLPIDETLLFQVAHVRFLQAVVRGEVDLVALAREELATRGLAPDGRWVGFQRARQIWATV